MVALGSQAVLFSGNNGAPFTGPNIVNYYDDTWAFNRTTWTSVGFGQAPPARQVAQATAWGNKVVLFGGLAEAAGATEAFDDTWVFDGAGWTQVVTSQSPSPRQNAAMAALGDKVVLFGGSPRTGPFLADTWTFDGTAWTQVPVAHAPPRRDDALMAPLGDRLVLCGGASDLAPSGYSDTWIFDGTDWTEVNLTHAPDLQDRYASFVLFPLQGKVVLFGWPQAWTFDGTTWSSVNVPDLPSARTDESIVYLPPASP
jgi:hypothetical protein